jgi:hypothetical protein
MLCDQIAGQIADNGEQHRLVTRKQPRVVQQRPQRLLRLKQLTRCLRPPPRTLKLAELREPSGRTIIAALGNCSPICTIVLVCVGDCVE